MGTQGKGFFKGQAVTFDLPMGWKLLAMAEPREGKPPASLEAMVVAALKNPVGMPPLAKILPRPNKRVVILSDDQTRPTPVGEVMLPLLAELNRLGVQDEDIDVIIARGTHRLPSEADLQKKLGAEVIKRLRVSVHDADATDLVRMGTTTRGTPVWINKIFAEAGLKIGIGLQPALLRRLRRRGQACPARRGGPGDHQGRPRLDSRPQLRGRQDGRQPHLGRHAGDGAPRRSGHED